VRGVGAHKGSKELSREKTARQKAVSLADDWKKADPKAARTLFLPEKEEWSRTVSATGQAVKSIQKECVYSATCLLPCILRCAEKKRAMSRGGLRTAYRLKGTLRLFLGQTQLYFVR
jgi:hypothetical protein